MRRRACSLVQGLIWPWGRDPASVSARTWANWLGHAAAAADLRRGGHGPDGGDGLSRAARFVGSGRAAGVCRGVARRRAAASGRAGLSSYGGAESGTPSSRTAAASGSGRCLAGRRSRPGTNGRTAPPADPESAARGSPDEVGGGDGSGM
jgi:hypothetical protein